MLLNSSIVRALTVYWGLDWY